MSKSSEEGAGNAATRDTGAGNVGQKDANENIYENRAGTKKIVRVVTVMAYVFSVSFAAILLSAYYVFLWEPPNPRLQRHPLAGDPQADYLIDNSLSNANFNKANTSAVETYASTESVHPNAKSNILERIMTRDKESRVNYPEKLVALPQELLAYEDVLELSRRTAAKPTKSTGSIESVSTILPIFLKTRGIISTRESIRGEDTKIGEAKVDHSLENNGQRNGHGDSRLSSPGKVDDETTSASPESNTLVVMSIGKPETTTVYHEIDNYSYPEAIGETVQNDKVTIANEETTETSEVSTVTPELGENFDAISRIHGAKLPELPDDEGSTTSATTISEVQIYPEEIARDFLKDDD